MNELQRKMLAKLTFEPETLPRNRNFATLAAPEFQRVRQRAAHLRSVLEMLRKSSPESVLIRRIPNGDVELRLGDVRGGSRISRVPPDEYDLLVGHEGTRQLLRKYGAPDVD